MDVDNGIVVNMSILTTTIDRAYDMRICEVGSRTRLSDNDMRISDPCQLIVYL